MDALNVWVEKLRDSGWLKACGLLAIVGVLGVQLGQWTLDPGKIRLLIALSLFVIIIASCVRNPTVALFFLAVYLPVLGLLRRALIPVAGWSSMDPLVIVGPGIVLLMGAKWFYDTYIGRQPIRDDTGLFRLVRWMLLVDCIQVLNPVQGSLLTGFAGIMFYIAPIGYMIVSRQYIDERKLRILCNIVLTIGVLTALYGYKQFFYGYSSFENLWVEMTGYTALKVYSIMRPISTFTSASEYAYYLAAATVIAWVYVLKGRWALKLFALLLVAFLYSALFIESARGTIVAVTMALTVISIVNAKGRANKIVAVGLAGIALAGLFIGISKLNTENDLIYHSVVGLTDPLGEESTLVGHLELMVHGFERGLANPLGHGLGSTTIAAGKFNGSGVSSEVDLSNKFLATGLAGGVLYLLIMARALYLAFRMARVSALHLIVLGILLSQGGQWLNGGHYSTVGLIWIMLGFLDKSSVSLQAKTKE